MHRAFLLIAFILVAPCSQVNFLAQTPNVLLPQAEYPDATLPNVLKTTQPTVYYMTDREPAPEINARIPYSHERSASMAFGQ